jgi:hypothetical protein
MVEQIQELRKKAELAVEDMQDSELKLKAFEVILQHLLTGDNITAPVSPIARATTTTAGGSASTPRKSNAPRSASERVLALQADGFFTAQRSIREIQAELKKRGWHYPLSALSGPLQILAQNKTLRREQLSDGGRKVWKYANR